MRDFGDQGPLAGILLSDALEQGGEIMAAAHDAAFDQDHVLVGVSTGIQL